MRPEEAEEIDAEMNHYQDQINRLRRLNKTLTADLEKARAQAKAAQELAEAMRKVASDLECGPPERDQTHYCPNCDHSLFNALQTARAAIAAFAEAGKP